MPKIDWDTLSLDELKEIQTQVAKAIESFEARKKAEALAAVEAKVAEMGYSLKELTGKSPSTAVRSAPKYRHPENPEITWSGRGRQPKWIKDALEAGQALDDFLI